MENDLNVAGQGMRREGSPPIIALAKLSLNGVISGQLIARRSTKREAIQGTLGHQVKRRKHGLDAVHPISGVELRALRRLKREQEPAQGTGARFVFVTERGGPIFSGQS
jgi:hypothetical protein